jgi:hypothetical protein
MAKHELRYVSIAEAIKDNFKEVGGMAEALSVLKAGWYAKQERKLQNDKNTRIRELVAKSPELKNLREQVKAEMKRKAGK